MRQLAILTFQTLDGVMQAPKLPDEDLSGGFKHGGWADPYWESVMALVGQEAMATPYDALFGRNTYDAFAEHQPAQDTPLGQAKKYVVTSRTSGLNWAHSEPLVGDVAEEVRKLKQADGPLLQVHGSWQLVQALVEYDLIDEYRLCTFPVLVGTGKRLFTGGAPPRGLNLVKTKSTEDGVVMSTYRRSDAAR